MPLIRRMIMEPKAPRHPEAATWGRLHQGAPIPVWVERASGGWKVVLLGELGGRLVRNSPFFSLTPSLSQAPYPGERAAEGLHSRESGWPGTSSLAVQTASPGPSAARPAKARKTEGSAHTRAESGCSGLRPTLPPTKRTASFIHSRDEVII